MTVVGDRGTPQSAATAQSAATPEPAPSDHARPHPARRRRLATRRPAARNRATAVEQLVYSTTPLVCTVLAAQGLGAAQFGAFALVATATVVVQGLVAAVLVEPYLVASRRWGRAAAVQGATRYAVVVLAIVAAAAGAGAAGVTHSAATAAFVALAAAAATGFEAMRGVCYAWRRTGLAVAAGLVRLSSAAILLVGVAGPRHEVLPFVLAVLASSSFGFAVLAIVLAPALRRTGRTPTTGKQRRSRPPAEKHTKNTDGTNDTDDTDDTDGTNGTNGTNGTGELAGARERADSRDRHGSLARYYAGEFVASSLAGQSVTYLVAATAGLPAAGALRIVQTILGPVNVLVSGLRLHVLSNSEPAQMPRLRRLVAPVLAATVAVGGFGAVVGALRGAQLFGDVWSMAAGVLPVGIVQYLVMSTYVLPLVWLRGNGRERDVLRLRVVSATTLVGFAAVGAYLAAQVGAACGLALSSLLSALMTYRLWKSELSNRSESSNNSELRDKPDIRQETMQ